MEDHKCQVLLRRLGVMRILLVLLLVSFAGCVADAPDDASPAPTPDERVPSFDYTPIEPDLEMEMLQHDEIFAGLGGTEIHARIVRPDGPGPFPVIAQFTPYTAPGCNVGTATPAGAVEPPVIGCALGGTFDYEFVRRGYAFAFGDVRGTGDSRGCLDLRGQTDIADVGMFADYLAAQPWSNGNVGFIGASYPGSEAHMAALSQSPAVKAVIPVVASTSFYHYHHNDGVPYNGNHALGGTNTGYTSEGIAYTYSPQYGAMKLIDQPQCPHAENAVVHGGLDQSGDYYAWWQERNLRPDAPSITTPVLMAQGLADWNVKPDHVANWFNRIESESKTFIGGQWGHAYPASNDGACREDDNVTLCAAPWGDWWTYAVSFFDTFLKEVDTGMFEGSTAWVQDNNRTWHRSTDWPPLGVENHVWSLDVTQGQGWYACPRDTHNRGQFALAMVEGATVDCAETPGQSIVFRSPPMEQDVLLSGTPVVMLSVDTGGRATHLTAVLDVLDEDGRVVVSRENYGYLNPIFRNGLMDPQPVPAGAYSVLLDMYPQEDLVRAGHSLRLTLASNDSGRTIEAYEEGPVVLDPTGLNMFVAPMRPAELQGLRL